jgi:hypothetical protein
MKATVLCSAVACALAVSAGVRVSQGVGEVVRGEEVRGEALKTARGKLLTF